MGDTPGQGGLCPAPAAAAAEHAAGPDPGPGGGGGGPGAEAAHRVRAARVRAQTRASSQVDNQFLRVCELSGGQGNVLQHRRGGYFPFLEGVQL